VWADGGRLYHDAWVDRPQGLMLVYRALLELHHDPLAIRLGAVAAGAAVTVLLLAVGWLAHSRAVGMWAATIYAVAGVAPRLEGYTLHAELAAAVPATAAVAAALLWSRRDEAWLLVVAGLLGAAGVLMKQSGFDGLVVAFAIAVSRDRALGRSLERGTLVVGGAALMLAASAIHGALVGFGEYWNALVGYRLAGGPSVSQRVVELAGSLELAARDLLPLVALAAVGAASCARGGAGCRLPLVWLAAAFAGFHVGGAYWAHYYLQLLPPLSLLAAVAVAGLAARRVRVVSGTAAVAPVALLFVQLILAAPDRRSDVIPSHSPAERDERVARYLRRHTAPDERIYVLVSRANVYFLAGRQPATRYLWHPPLQRIRGAMRQLERGLSHPRGPAFIVRYQPVADVDRSGHLARILATHYVVDRRAPPELPAILHRRRR